MMRSFNSAHRLTGVSTTAGSLTKNYGYTLNIKDQRIKTTLADGSYWDYAYDNYGQVINAVRKNASGGIAGQSFNYSFDQVGNRQSAFQGTTGSDSQWSYTANAVNQYSLITEPNGTTYAQVHDADGNLTGSYTTQYTYDAENRLKTADVGTYRHEYTYDYQGRRIRQKVILKSGATGQTQSEVAYVYDGWNVVGVYDTMTAAPTFQKGYLWGEDLSGSLQGAGGVGGLLAEKRGGQTYLPVYDGNGNIMSYLNASTKASVAEYVYDAFGRTISSSGTEADNFTYRFSTKPMDGNGLYYYGYRYYDPQHGRWISRDPLEEEGGVNLYGFIQNNGVKFIDVNGLWGWDGDYIETIWIMMSDDSADGDAVREAFFMEAWDRGNATADALTFDATKALRQKLNCDIVFDEESYEKQRCFASCWERITASALTAGILDKRTNWPAVSDSLGIRDIVNYWQDDNMLGVSGSATLMGLGHYARIYERRSREQQEIFERLRVSARRNQHKKKQPNEFCEIEEK